MAAEGSRRMLWGSGRSTGEAHLCGADFAGDEDVLPGHFGGLYSVGDLTLVLQCDTERLVREMKLDRLHRSDKLH